MDTSIVYCSGTCSKNYYIHHSLSLLCHDNYSSIDCFKTIHNLIYYLFNNISENKRNELVKLWMDTVQTPIDDEYYFTITYNWMKSITQRDNVGYAAYASKADLISKVVKPYMAHKGTYVDFGAGDCKFSKDMGTLLGLKPYTIKMPNAHAVHTPQGALCKEIGLITTSELRVPKDTSVLVFNYCLHHFKTEEKIKAIIQEAYDKLPQKALLVIYDHNSDNDIWLNLTHILLEIKFFKSSLPELKKHMKAYRANFQATYFNKTHITNICKKVGFTLKKFIQRPSQTKDVCDKSHDLSNTMILCFKKQSNTRKA